MILPLEEHTISWQIPIFFDITVQEAASLNYTRPF